LHENEVLGDTLIGHLLPYFFTRYMKNSGSFCMMDIIAPTIENDVAYHGPGNFERGCSFCM
jgi:hypothetical protein